MVVDWVAFIKTIPGLAKAVAELIGDAANLGSSAAKLGSAKLDQSRRAVEDQTNRATALSEATTNGEVALTNAITDAAVDYIKGNSLEIGERALKHGIHRLVKQQHNREMVMLETMENLRLNPPASTPDEMPSDDWLNLFGRYAENASSEKMRQHWAHILEGEIRRPGCFSFATLQLASILDERLANIIESFRPWVFEGGIPMLESIVGGERYSDIITLAGIGFISLGNHGINATPEPGDMGKVAMKLEGGIVVVSIPPPIKIGTFERELRVSIPSAIITPAGKELLNALPPVKQNHELVEIFRAYLAEEGFKDITVKAG